MTTKQIVSNFVNTTANSKQSPYSAPAAKNVIIESFTAANNSSVNASYKAYIVPVSGVEQPQRPFKVVIWGEIDLGIGIVNQVIPAGGKLLVECSATNSVFFTITGREVDT